jgi:hypothetical protein
MLKQAKQFFQLKCCQTMLHMFQALVATSNLIMLYYQHCHVSKYETPMLHLQVVPLSFHKLTILKQPDKAGCTLMLQAIQMHK